MSNVLNGFPVGARVYAKRSSGVCSKGEAGLVIEDYSIGGEGGRTIIFESGNYDGFSEKDLMLFVLAEGSIDRGCSSYIYTNAMRLSQDYQKGLFDFSYFQPFNAFMAKKEKEVLDGDIKPPMTSGIKKMI